MPQSGNAVSFPPLDEALFTRPQVREILEVTDGRLKGIVDRRLVEVRVHNPGRGGSRKFSTADLIKLAVALEMGRIGVPMRVLANCAELVRGRAHRLLADFLALRKGDAEVASISNSQLPLGFHLILYPEVDPDGKWIVHGFFPENDNQSSWPISYVILNVDKVIKDLISKITSLPPPTRKKKCST